jgi:uncharacterized protein involved in exopolysaccharide biosynthesis
MQNAKTPRQILRYIFLVIFRKKFMILTIISFALLSFAFATFLISPKWKATTKIMVLENPKQQMILFKDLAAPSRTEKVSANDLVEILTSKAFASQIVKKYKLDELKRQKAQNPQKLRDKIKLFLAKMLRSPFILATKLGLLKEKEPNFFADAVDELIKEMEDIELGEGTSTISLSVWGENPELASGIANSLASMLIEKTKEFERSEAAGAYDFAKLHSKSLSEALHKAEDELSAFREREKVVDLEKEKSLNVEKWFRLSEEYEDNKTNLFAMKEKLRELNKQLSSLPTNINATATSRVNTVNELLQKSLAESEIEIAKLKKNLKEKHPDIVALEAQIEINREKLDKEPEYKTYNSISQILEKDIIATKALIAELESKDNSLRDSIIEVERKLDSLPRLEVSFERLNRSYNTLKERYLTLSEKLLELEVLKYTQLSQFDLKISDPAYIPEGTQPDWPSLPLNLVVGLFVGFCLSFGMAFVLEYFSDTLRTPEQVSTDVELKVLGVVPSVSHEKVLSEINNWSQQKLNNYGHDNVQNR